MNEIKKSKTSKQNFKTFSKKEFASYYSAKKCKEMAESRYKNELESDFPTIRLRIRRREEGYTLLLMKRINNPPEEQKKEEKTIDIIK